MLKITDKEKCKRVIKYILMGLVMVVSLRYIPSEIIKMNEIIMISLVSSISFGLLDMISPSILIKQKM